VGKQANACQGFSADGYLGHIYMPEVYLGLIFSLRFEGYLPAD